MDELHRIVGSQFSWRMILPDRNFYLANTNDGWRSFLPSQCEGIYPLVLSFLPSFYPSCPRQRTAFQLPFCMLHFVDCVLSTNWCLRILPLTSPPPLSLSVCICGIVPCSWKRHIFTTNVLQIVLKRGKVKVLKDDEKVGRFLDVLFCLAILFGGISFGISCGF